MTGEVRALYPAFVVHGCPTLIYYTVPYAAVPLTVGITNQCWMGAQSRYTWFMDFDVKPLAPHVWDVLKRRAWLIYETEKGYHAYLDVWEPTFWRAVKRVYRLYRLPGADRLNLRAPIDRARKGDPRLNVIRLAGKNGERYVLVHRREPQDVPLWYVEAVLGLLRSFGHRV